MTDSASHPNVFVVFIVGLAGTSSVADDRVVVANRTSPREEVQWDHPGSMLSFVSGSAINRITAGVRTGLHPPGEIMVERKKNTAICGLAVTLFADWPV
jgi:hypothetical protein